MNRSLCLVGVICIFAASVLNAQDRRGENINMLGDTSGQGRRRAVVIDINARVLENEQVVIWNETHQKITIPGTPVELQLVGSNVAVKVQFTPFIRRHGNVLVAQGQIWINNPDNRVSYYTSIQTIPMEFNEPIYFFPLGQSEEASSIEIILTVNPYTANDTNDDE